MPVVKLSSKDNRSLHFDRCDGGAPGEGLTALLLHRVGGAALSWGPVMERFPGRISAIALDMPGRAGSEGPALETIEEMAEITSAFIEELELSRVVLCGHSMGGAVALTTASRRPDLVDSLLLVSSGARLRVAKPVFLAVRTQFEALTHIMKTMIFAPTTSKEVRDSEPLFRTTQDVVIKDLEASNVFDGEPLLDELAVPVKMFMGKEDSLTPPHIGRRLVDRVPNGVLKVVEGAAHMLPQEEPEMIAETIISLCHASSEGHDDA